MRVDRPINVLSEITLIEMMVTIGLGVRFSDVSRASRNYGRGARAALANYILVPAAALGLLLRIQAAPSECAAQCRAALDLIFSNHFTRHEPGISEPLRETFLTGGGHYMHLAKLASYLEAHQRAGDFYSDADACTWTAILNVAGSGKFSSDRTIAQYAAEIRKVQLCPVS